jgi:hypothetical protein
MELRIYSWDSTPEELRLAAKLLMELAALKEPTLQPIEPYAPVPHVAEVTVEEQHDAPINSIPPTPVELKPKRGRPRTKNAEAPAEPVQQPAEAPASAPVEPVASTPSELTRADVTAATNKLIDKLGGNNARLTAIELLKPFGVTKTSDLPAEKYGEFIQACEAAAK